jgi:hypothetical protein
VGLSRRRVLDFQVGEGLRLDRQLVSEAVALRLPSSAAPSLEIGDVLKVMARRSDEPNAPTFLAKGQNVPSCNRTRPRDAQRCSLQFSLKVTQSGSEARLTGSNPTMYPLTGAGVGLERAARGADHLCPVYSTTICPWPTFEITPMPLLTERVFSASFDCQTKCYLLLNRRRGQKTEYEKHADESDRTYRREGIAKLQDIDRGKDTLHLRRLTSCAISGSPRLIICDRVEANEWRSDAVVLFRT